MLFKNILLMCSPCVGLKIDIQWDNTPSPHTTSQSIQDETIHLPASQFETEIDNTHTTGWFIWDETTDFPASWFEIRIYNITHQLAS
jgi:hypothetical protein